MTDGGHTGYMRAHMQLRNVPSNASEDASKYFIFFLAWNANFTKPGFSTNVNGFSFNLTFASAGVARKIAGRKTLKLYANPQHMPNRTYRSIVQKFQAYGGLSFVADFQETPSVLHAAGYVRTSQRCPYL